MKGKEGGRVWIAGVFKMEKHDNAILLLKLKERWAALLLLVVSFAVSIHVCMYACAALYSAYNHHGRVYASSYVLALNRILFTISRSDHFDP